MIGIFMIGFGMGGLLGVWATRREMKKNRGDVE